MSDRRNRELESPIRIPGLGWRGLILQLIFVTVLPLTVLLLVIVVPTVVALVARTASATAQRLNPVRVSTATFE